MPPIESFSGIYAFLSNFYPSPMRVDGKHFQTNEHYYQACKASTDEEFEYVRTAGTAAQAKRRGREVKLTKGWDNHKNEVMLKGLRIKFAIPELRALLLGTGDAILIEANNWHDVFFGRCDCSKHGGAGENWLGRLLMAVRAEIPKETP